MGLRREWNEKALKVIKRWSRKREEDGKRTERKGVF